MTITTSSDVIDNADSSDNTTDNNDMEMKHLVLVGGGHAHVQVLKALNRAARPANLRVTLIDQQRAASYSGMVPGCIANYYAPEDTLLQLEQLTAWAGIEFVCDRVVDVDPDRKLIYTRHGDAPIPFDALSLDIGSTSRDIDRVPGARAYTIPTRPIDQLIRRLDRARQELDDQASAATTDDHTAPVVLPPRLVIVGGGVAGIELALSITSRWKDYRPQTTLLDAGQELLPDESPAARTKLAALLQAKGIHVQHGAAVERIEEDRVVLQKDGQSIPFSHCVWATGAGAHALAHHLSSVRGIATTPRGWIRVGPTLQSVSHPHIFSAGDCAHMEGLEAGSPPKAGVYAVRAGPILIDNLTRFLVGDGATHKQGHPKVPPPQPSSTTSPCDHAPLQRYEPQRDFMKLLVCGDGKALGLRFGLALYGKWVFAVKNRIDQNFMNLFRHLPSLENIAPGSYDTSQYDAPENNQDLAGLETPTASEAAGLLQRTDDEVDWRLAWHVLRTMTQDKDYRNEVLECVEKTIDSAVLEAV
jgi:selenide,water dikinase